MQNTATRSQLPFVVTAQDMQKAFASLAKPHWPNNLAAAMQHAVYSRCITGMAREVARERHRLDVTLSVLNAMAPTPPRRVVPPAPLPRYLGWVQQAGRAFDIRKAQANDKD